MLPLSHILKHRVAQDSRVSELPSTELHELLGNSDGQLAKQRRIYHTEDCRACTDAKSQRQDSGAGKARALANHAQCMAQFVDGDAGHSPSPVYRPDTRLRTPPHAGLRHIKDSLADEPDA